MPKFSFRIFQMAAFHFDSFKVNYNVSLFLMFSEK